MTLNHDVAAICGKLTKAQRAQRRPIPSRDRLRALLDFDAQTGLFTWRERPSSEFASSRIARSWNSKFAWKSAFVSNHSQGYQTGCIDNVSYFAHRVAWKYVYGIDPDEIDHINGNRSDNRLINLRSVSHSENLTNMPARRETSRVPGVGLTKHGTWRARLGQRILGYYPSQTEAETARLAAEKAAGHVTRRTIDA